MKRTLFLACVALTLMATQVQGQMKWTVDLGGGVTEPTGDYADQAKMGWNAVGSIGVVPGNSPFAIQATGYFSQQDVDVAGFSGTWKFGGVLGELRFDPLNNEKLMGSILLGGGYMNVKADVSPGGSSDDWKGAFDGGLGLAYKMSEKAAIFFVARYVQVFFDGPDMTFVPLTAGLRYTFQ